MKQNQLTSFTLVLPKADDDILRLLRLTSEVVFEDALGTVRITSLGIEGGAGVVRNHTVTATEGVLHGTPNMVFGSGLFVPDIAGVT